MPSRLLIWLPLAWVLPALLASALGGSGVWGGPALPDLLVPVPVAGGALHVPSFVVCGALVWLVPTAGTQSAWRLQALLLGLALAGLLWLLKLDAMWVSWRADGHWPGWRWEHHPLGLFLLCDAALALLFTARWPGWRALGDPVAALLLGLPLVGPVTMAARSGLVNEAFVVGQSRPGQVRGDEVLMVFTRLNMQAPDVVARALAWAEPYHPRRDINADDTALLFTDSLEAARRMETARAVRTLCLYEDGTQPLWLPGGQPEGCFERHLSFQERLVAAHAARPAGEPPALASYLARKAACEAVPTPVGNPGGVGQEVSALRLCAALPELKAEVLRQHPGWLDQAR